MKNIGQELDGRHGIVAKMIGSRSMVVIEDSSFHTSINRGVSIQSSKNVNVDFNVFYKIAGHGVSLDNGFERNN